MNRFTKAGLAAATALALLGVVAARASAEPSGLEYDQITWVSADPASHLPGSFQGDLAAIKVALLNGELGSADSRKRVAEIFKEASDPARRLEMSALGRIPGVGLLAVLIASNAQTIKLRSELRGPGQAQVAALRLEQQLGKWYHVTYLNGWTRREDVSNQTVLIVKPDQDTRIYVDLALRTYYTASANAPGSSASSRAMLCSPSTTVNRGAQVLDGVPTDIFETTFDANGTSAVVTRYESPFTEPPKRDGAWNLIPFDCPGAPTHTGPAMPIDRVALYEKVFMSSGSHSVTMVNEEGNIKRTDPEPALFEVPPGFVKKSPLDIIRGHPGP
jgi:hypothetical protein